MKILMLAPQPFFQTRGTPIAVRRIATVLGRAGHSVELMVFHEGDDVAIPNCTLHRTLRIPLLKNIPPGFSIRKIVGDICMVVKAVAHCRRHSVDVVHAVEESVFIARILKLLFRIPYLYDMDSSLPEQLNDRFPWLGLLPYPMRKLERIAIAGSEGVIAVCHALEEIVHRESPQTPVLRMEDSSPHTICGSPNEDDVSLRHDSSPSILYVGNLQAYQGIDLLLNAFQRTVQSLPSANLTIVGGDARDIDRYNWNAKELGIADRVEFTGPKPLESIPAYLRAADIVVSPRIQGTNTPMKVYSYMESGTPLVATRLVTHTQVLDDSMCWLADPDPESFSNAIIGAFHSGDQAELKARKAQRHAADDYSAEVQDEKLILFYEDVESRIRRRASGRARTLLTTGSSSSATAKTK